MSYKPISRHHILDTHTHLLVTLFTISFVGSILIQGIRVNFLTLITRKKEYTKIAALSSATIHEMFQTPKQCYNTRFPPPTMLTYEYKVNLLFINLIYVYNKLMKKETQTISDINTQGRPDHLGSRRHGVQSAL